RDSVACASTSGKASRGCPAPAPVLHVSPGCLGTPSTIPAAGVWPVSSRGVPGSLVGGTDRYEQDRMTTAQSFLFLLILLGGAATAVRLLSRTTATIPYPVLLAVGGIVIGLVPGIRLPPI